MLNGTSPKGGSLSTFLSRAEAGSVTAEEYAGAAFERMMEVISSAYAVAAKYNAERRQRLAEARVALDESVARLEARDEEIRCEKYDAEFAKALALVKGGS